MTRTLAACVVAVALPWSPLLGQAPDTPPDSTPASTIPRTSARPTAQDSAPSLPASPRGALIRSLILPGWGQAQFESYFRGGIYFAGWAGNWFMNFRNAYRLDNARTRFQLRRQQIETALIAGSANPDSLRAQLDSFPTLLEEAVQADSAGNDLRKLVRSREQQREDWIAWSIFWVLASGIDAYVTAQLADFPAEVELRPERRQGLTLRVGVPWPGRFDRRSPALPRPPRPPDGPSPAVP